MPDTDMDRDLLRCPRCLAAVQAAASGVACRACNVVYPVRDGIVDLRCQRQDYYFNPVPRDTMAALVREAPAVSWDTTIRGFLRHVKSVSDWIDNVAVNGRYSWKLFLDLPPDARVLDFGCGLGNLTQSIAPHVGEVVALDLTWERLLFAQQRFATFNRGCRITAVAAGDGAHLPFPDGAFDCITLSGVLEWIPEDPSIFASTLAGLPRKLAMLMSFFGETNPRKAQIRFLRELRRILRPDGQLFVAIENRWNYEYFQGRRDHHSGLKYGALLPRFVANVYSIGRRAKPYRTYTHSVIGLKRLLRAAGFSGQQCLGLTPGYTGLAEILPFEGEPALWRTPAAADRKAQIRRSKYFVPAFGMIGRNGSTPSASLIGRLVRDLERKSPALAPITLETCIVTGKEKVVFAAATGSGRIVIKMPADEYARAGEQNNRRMLERLAADATMSALVPKPIAHDVYQGVEYFVEQATGGVSLRTALRTMSRAEAAAQVGELLVAVHRRVAPPTTIAPRTPDYETLLRAPLDVLRSSGLDATLCDAAEARLRNLLTSHPWPLGLYHGDFSKNNIFVVKGRISGVIDWEYATERGLPLLDAIGYVDSVRRLIDKWAGRDASMSANMQRLARWDWDTPEEVELLRRLYQHFGVDSSVHPTLCQLAWLHHTSRTLQTKMRFDRRFIEQNAGPMLAAVAG